MMSQLKHNDALSSAGRLMSPCSFVLKVFKILEAMFIIVFAIIKLTKKHLVFCRFHTTGSITEEY